MMTKCKYTYALHSPKRELYLVKSNNPLDKLMRHMMSNKTQLIYTLKITENIYAQ